MLRTINAGSLPGVKEVQVRAAPASSAVLLFERKSLHDEPKEGWVGTAECRPCHRVLVMCWRAAHALHASVKAVMQGTDSSALHRVSVITCERAWRGDG